MSPHPFPCPADEIGKAGGEEKLYSSKTPKERPSVSPLFEKWFLPAVMHLIEWCWISHDIKVKMADMYAYIFLTY